MSKILLVDDEEEMLGLLETRLRQYGHDIIKAHGGQEAFNKINENKIDLIILDVNMPQMNGFDVKDRLNQDKSTAQIPVIFLSALGRVPNKVTGFVLGADDYINKPFDSHELIARVNCVLARRFLNRGQAPI